MLRFFCFLLTFCLVSSLAIAQDNATGTWSRAKNLPVPLRDVAAAAVDGKVYVSGGSGDFMFTSNALYVYDPASNEWSAGAPVPIDVAQHAMVVAGEKIFLLGGVSRGGSAISRKNNRLFVYDPVLDEWTERSSMQKARRAFAVAALEQQIFVLGGLADETVNGVQTEIITDVFEVYDIEADNWRQEEPITSPVAFGAAAVVDSLIYRTGGTSFANATWEVLAYSAETTSWRDVPRMSERRNLHKAISASGRIVVFGGSDGFNNMLKRVEAFDPVNLTWMQLADMPVSRTNLAAAAIGDKIYAIGGTSVPGSIEPSDLVEVLELPTFQSTSTEAHSLPGTVFELQSNYPNPFRETTTIKYDIFVPSDVRITIFDMLGKQVTTSDEGRLQPGQYAFTWKPGGVAPGIYIYRIEAGAARQSRTLTYLR